MVTYNVHGGHSLKCRGASGLLDEVNEDRKVKNRVIELLHARGATVYDCTDDGGTTPIKNLKNIVSKCNVHKVDLDVSIHLNAGGGHGCEVYGYSNKMSGVGARVSANIASALGITNRGFKVRTNLYVLHRTNSPAILIECCFVDSKEDYDKWSVDKCANAIVDALMNTTTTTTNTNTPKPTPKPATVKHRFNLKVDGKIGHDTVKAMQAWLGTPQDGIVSGQSKRQRKYLIACVEDSWRFLDNPKGSLMVKALQKKLGCVTDGIMGKNTVMALQRMLNVKQDGYLGSDTAKALQIYLNRL